MRQSPLILLEANIDERINIVYEEYITSALTEYQTLLGDSQGFDAWANNLQNALNRIQRRLGGLRYNHLKSVMEDAILRHRTAYEPEHHKEWIRALLVEYYDPMYDYQLEKKSDRVVYRGESDELLEYVNRQLSNQ
jgi:tRNA 2-selenouridine synthase